MESKVKAGPTIELIRTPTRGGAARRAIRANGCARNVDGPVSPALVEVLARPGRPASVLLALLERPGGLAVLLTERAAHLKDHAGQISLPGGRLAPGETPAAAALREAHEEVGLPPDAVDGARHARRVAHGHRLHRDARRRRRHRSPRSCRVPDPREVADVFEVPLELVLHPSGITVGYFERHGVAS